MSSTPARISCGSVCSANFAGGTSVTLTEVAAAGKTFAGWSGACAGKSSTCTVSMTAARSVNAGFSVITSLIEDNSASLAYAGTWATGSGSGVVCSPNHSRKTSKIRGNRAVASFKGTRVSWIASRGPTAGTANVYIDGVFRRTVNLYATSVHDGAVVYSSPALSRTSHTLRVQLTLAKAVNIDAVRVTP